jgi:hypothetical protein
MPGTLRPGQQNGECLLERPGRLAHHLVGDRDHRGEGEVLSGLSGQPVEEREEGRTGILGCVRLCAAGAETDEPVALSQVDVQLLSNCSTRGYPPI